MPVAQAEPPEVRMKLVHCLLCGDIVALRPRERSCECGASSGRYVDHIWVEVIGPCRVLGTRNDQIRHSLAVEHVPHVGPNYRWWVVLDGHHVRRRRGDPASSDSSETERTL
jgi:hypothetical protein